MNASFVMAPAWFLIALVGIAVVAGIILVVRAIAKGSGRSVGLLFAALIVAGVLLGFISVRTQQFPHPPQVAYEQHGPQHNSSEQRPLPIDSVYELRHGEPAVPRTSHEHEPAGDHNSTPKPAWLTQGTQTGNGVSQFPISSELFATVAECQKDLDRRMPALIAEELRFLVGEEFAIPLLPGEGKLLTAETYTEEVPTQSQGNWYKIHRLVKVDKAAWADIQERFQQAKTEARLRSLALSFGGLMLVLGVVYLILRRTPRSVDPTLNTFSTT